MSVPLDRLYYFIEDISKKVYGKDIIIYRFYPHGSKKITDLEQLRPGDLTWKQGKLLPQIYCNDQEPLNYDLYTEISAEDIGKISQGRRIYVTPPKNFRLETFVVWDKALLLHSEQRSQEIEKYKHCDFIPVYYWSHALISLDWFRYARHVSLQKKSKKLFLIYARGWTGTREYRLKFLELLIQHGMHDACHTAIQPTDQDIKQHYGQYKFRQEIWRPGEVLENYFTVRDQLPATLSADFDLHDYEFTDIEVVLETLFDDARLHFTEKILRPIALGQPFILVGSSGGLQYLKQYGFKTYSDVWNEDYDAIQDPQLRMQAIVDLMKSIQNWSDEQKNSLMLQARAIADFNKQRFFSQDFFHQITQELEQNLLTAFDDLENNNRAELYYKTRQKMFEDPAVWQANLAYRSQQDSDDVYDVVLSYHNRHR